MISKYATSTQILHEMQIDLQNKIYRVILDEELKIHENHALDSLHFNIEDYTHRYFSTILALNMLLNVFS